MNKLLSSTAGVHRCPRRCGRQLHIDRYARRLSLAREKIDDAASGTLYLQRHKYRGSGQCSSYNRLEYTSGPFTLLLQHTLFQEFRYLNSYRRIQWLNGRGTAPLAEPLCGFYHEKCKPKLSDWRYIIAGVFIALFLAVAGAFLLK